MEVNRNEGNSSSQDMVPPQINQKSKSSLKTDSIDSNDIVSDDSSIAKNDGELLTNDIESDNSEEVINKRQSNETILLCKTVPNEIGSNKKNGSNVRKRGRPSKNDMIEIQNVETNQIVNDEQNIKKRAGRPKQTSKTSISSDGIVHRSEIIDLCKEKNKDINNNCFNNDGLLQTMTPIISNKCFANHTSTASCSNDNITKSNSMDNNSLNNDIILKNKTNTQSNINYVKSHSISPPQINALNTNYQSQNNSCTSSQNSFTNVVHNSSIQESLFQIPSIKDSIYENSTPYLYQNRWEIYIDDFEDNRSITNKSITNCVKNIRNALKDLDENEFQIRPINPGIFLNKKNYVNFIKNLPTHLKEDYLCYKKDYCIVSYETILNIIKSLNGKHDYHYNGELMKKRLPLYFDVQRDQLNNKLSLRNSEKLIDVFKSYILLQKKEPTPLYLVNQQIDYVSVNVHRKEGNYFLNLPTYKDSITPNSIFTITVLLRDFLTEYEKPENNNTLLICPKNVLSYLHEYETRLKFIENNCFLLPDIVICMSMKLD